MKMAKKPNLEKQLLDMIDYFTPKVKNAFLAAISDVSDKALLSQVIKAVEMGDPIAAFKSLGFSDAAMRPITKMLEEAFENGGITTGNSFPNYLNTTDGRVVFRFDVRDSRAEKFLREQSAQLVTNIQEDTRIALRNVLTDGMTNGRNPRLIALDIVGRFNPKTEQREGGIIGLTPAYERAVARAKEELRNLNPQYLQRKQRLVSGDDMVQAAIASGKPLSEEDIDRLGTRYANNLLRLRGETIARTEVMHSIHKAEYEALMQAVDDGAVNKAATRRVWDATGDTRTRLSHMMMDGQEVGLDEAFTSPVTGVKLMFPGDTSARNGFNNRLVASECINCRCRVRLKVDWLYDID